MRRRDWYAGMIHKVRLLRVEHTHGSREMNPSIMGFLIFSLIDLKLRRNICLLSCDLGSFFFLVLSSAGSKLSYDWLCRALCNLLSKRSHRFAMTTGKCYMITLSLLFHNLMIPSVLSCVFLVGLPLIRLFVLTRGRLMGGFSASAFQSV